MNTHARKVLRDFYFGDLSAQSFEEWLYKDAVLEKIFHDEYIDLISLDYKNSDDCLKAKEIVKKIYDPSDGNLIFKHKALETVQGMLDSSIPLENGCHVLSKMYNAGMAFIPVHFAGYDSEFTDKDRRDMFDMTAFYSERIKRDCLILCNNLMPYAESKGTD